jgi:hypothetical protein
MKNKASLYKLSNPHKAPKPAEYDPENEQSELEQHLFRIYREYEEEDNSNRRRERAKV